MHPLWGLGSAGCWDGHGLASAWELRLALGGARAVLSLVGSVVAAAHTLSVLGSMVAALAVLSQCRHGLDGAPSVSPPVGPPGLADWVSSPRLRASGLRRDRPPGEGVGVPMMSPPGRVSSRALARAHEGAVSGRRLAPLAGDEAEVAS